MRQLAAFSAEGSVHFDFRDFRHMAEILAAGKAAYSELLNLCVWAKNNGGMGSSFMPRTYSPRPASAAPAL